MSIEAVIWDLGGVLLRTEDPSMRQGLAERFRMTRSELEQFIFNSESGKRTQIGEITLDEHWETMRNSLGIEASELDDFQKSFWGGDMVDYNLVDYIRSLRKGSYKTGLLSNAFPDLRQYLTEVWAIADAFDVLVISAEVGLVKPDPRIYQLALERLDVKADQAVFIDDFAENVQGARALGIQAIHFQNPTQTRLELEKLLNGIAP